MRDIILECTLPIPANAGYHIGMYFAYTRKCGIPYRNVLCLYPQMRDTISECTLPISANAGYHIGMYFAYTRKCVIIDTNENY